MGSRPKGKLQGLLNQKLQQQYEKPSWLDRHINHITALNMVATFILSIVVAIATISITKTQRDIEYQEASPSFNVNAEYQESRRLDSKDADYDEPLAGVNEITKVTISNDGAMLYKPEFKVYPFYQIKRMVNQGVKSLQYYEDEWDSLEEYQEAIKHPQYYLETLYRPVLLNTAEQNLNLYRITITGTKRGELCTITDSSFIKAIITLFDGIKPIYTMWGNSNGLFWVFQDEKYVDKDRAMMYVSLEYFIEITYSTTMNKNKTETEIYHVVTGHDAYIGTADFGEPVKVELLTSNDWLYQYYQQMKMIRDSGIVIASDYPQNQKPEDFVKYYEWDIGDVFHSVNLEVAEKVIKDQGK